MDPVTRKPGGGRKASIQRHLRESFGWKAVRLTHDVPPARLSLCSRWEMLPAKQLLPTGAMGDELVSEASAEASP